MITDFELDASVATDPFPGITGKLIEMRKQGLRLGVVTRNCRAAVLQVFPDLLDYVDVVHARGDTPHLKPDPRHLQSTLDALAVSSSSAAMVGDGALDMKTGKAIGMTCVGVLTGSADESQLLEAGADVVLADCLKLLDN